MVGELQYKDNKWIIIYSDFEYIGGNPEVLGSYQKKLVNKELLVVNSNTELFDKQSTHIVNYKRVETDGNMTAEIIPDIKKSKTKRVKLNDLFKIHNYDELSYWKSICLAAEKYIEESPCDPDITTDQIIAYDAWLKIVKNEK